MADIVGRLRRGEGADPDTYELYEEAADEIERLRAEVNRLNGLVSGMIALDPDLKEAFKAASDKRTNGEGE